MKYNCDIDYFKSPINKDTFKNKDMKKWTENLLEGLEVLNLYAGKTLLNLKETRNDINPKIPADYHMDAFECCELLYKKKQTFEGVILDPPYSDRKSMEFYNGHRKSKFKLLREIIPKILIRGGLVITFGYNSNVFGKTHGFKLIRIGLFCHGGAIHDTIAAVERFVL